MKPLSANDIGSLIRKHGARWWGAKYVATAGQVDAPWLLETEGGVALCKGYTFAGEQFPDVPTLERLTGYTEEENTTLGLITTEHVDRWRDRMEMAGGSAQGFNGAVTDTHKLGSVMDVLGSCLAIYPITLPDGVPAWAGVTCYHCETPESQQALRMEKKGALPSKSIGAFIDTFAEDKPDPDAPAIQVMKTWRIYHYSPCPVPVNPWATAAREIVAKSLAAPIREGIIKSSDAIVAYFTGSARKVFSLPAMRPQPAPEAVAPVVPPVVRAASKAAPASVHNSLTRILNSLKNLNFTEMDEILKALEGAGVVITDAQKAMVKNAAGAELSAKNKASKEACQKAIEDALESCKAHVEASEAAADHADKMAAFVAKALDHVKAIGGEGEPEGKPEDKPAEEKPEGEKSLREQVREKVKAKHQAATTAQELAELKAMVAKLQAPAPSAAAAPVVVSLNGSK